MFTGSYSFRLANASLIRSSRNTFSCRIAVLHSVFSRSSKNAWAIQSFVVMLPAQSSPTRTVNACGEVCSSGSLCRKYFPPSIESSAPAPTVLHARGFQALCAIPGRDFQRRSEMHTHRCTRQGELPRSTTLARSSRRPRGGGGRLPQSAPCPGWSAGQSDLIARGKTGCWQPRDPGSRR